MPKGKGYKFTVKPSSQTPNNIKSPTAAATDSDLPSMTKKVKKKHKSKPKPNPNPNPNLSQSKIENVTSEIIKNGKDEIHFYEISTKYAVEYDRKLMKDNPNDLLIVQAADTTYYQNIDVAMDRKKIKPIYSVVDHLFRTALEMIEMLIELNVKFDFDRVTTWIIKVIDIIGLLRIHITHHAAPVFDRIYDNLDLLYPNKTVHQAFFFRFLQNRYKTSESVLERHRSIDTLIVQRLMVKSTIFESKQVVDVLCLFFQLVFAVAFDMKMNAVFVTLTDSEWALSGKISNATAYLAKAEEFHLEIDQKLQSLMAISGEILSKHDRNTSELKLATIYAKELEQAAISVIRWKKILDITNAVYEFRFVDKILDKDIHIQLFDIKQSIPIFAELYYLGYPNFDRFKCYKISVNVRQVKKQQTLLFTKTPLLSKS